MRHSQSLDFATVLTLTIAFTTGCATKPVEEPVEHSARKVVVDDSETAPETTPGEPTADSVAKNEFETALKKNLEQLDEEIRELRTKVGALQEAAKAEWTERMTEVDAKRKATEGKLEEIRKSAGGAWEHLREGAGRAWEELEQAVKKAKAEF